MRLSYYEFFGKFFTGGGMRFEPLVLTPAKEEKSEVRLSASAGL